MQDNTGFFLLFLLIFLLFVALGPAPLSKCDTCSDIPLTDTLGR